MLFRLPYRQRTSRVECFVATAYGVVSWPLRSVLPSHRPPVYLVERLGQGFFFIQHRMTVLQSLVAKP